MSAKTSAQPGRRTPLSLSGAVTKTHPIKGGNNAANGSGNNANLHSASNANKQENNKQQQSKTEHQPQATNNSDTKENPNKKQQQQADKKQQQNENNKKSNEKNQNGVNNNKQQTPANENKQQQQNKDKQQQQQQQQQQNGNDNKSNEKDKKEKTDKPEKMDKRQEKPEKETKEVKEIKKVEQDKPDSKKEEKKSKDVKENNKEDKKEAAAKVEEKTEKQQSQAKKDDKKSNEENQVKNVEEKPTEKIEIMEIVEEQQSQQKSPPVTPKTNSKANKTSTPVNKTPTKASEKTPQKSTPSNNSAKTAPITKRVVTTAVDDDEEEDNDIEMEPLAVETSPMKSSQREENAHINIAPSATSTPGKILLSKRNTAAPKTDVQLAMQTGISPERPRVFSQISGRKSIRPISDYTPSKFQMNPQFRESYRRINTELDVTNTSMNVTVGSEVPNNLSFSFFGRGRKRDRTPPQHSQSAIGELQTDMEISPPKRARLDMYGFFNAVSSPLSLLRNRFSKATLQSSTPVKLQEKLNSSEDEIEVQNVSGVSVHEELANTEKELSENNTKTNDNNDATIGEEAKETKLKGEDIVKPTAVEGESEGKEFTDVSLKCEKACAMEETCELQSDIKITETPLQPAVGDPMAKNKRCIVM